MTDNYTFFYGHDPKKSTLACFSQWYPCKFQDADGHSFRSAEQYMMWRKAVLFKDEAKAKAVLASKTPKTAKALGRKVANFDQTIWDANCDEIVRDGSYLKFAPHEENRDIYETLLGTGTSVLAEASPRDRIWGIGYSAPNALKEENRVKWGQNKLGEALMATRKRLWDEREAMSGAE